MKELKKHLMIQGKIRGRRINSKFVLSVSFGDYKNTRGGIAKVISAHQEMFNRHGVSYVCIYPYNLSNSKPKKNNKYWGVNVDGVLRNVFSTENLLIFLEHLYEQGSFCESIHIHHLMKISIEELMKVLDAIPAKVIFYIHDYYTICNSTTLINEEGELCRDKFLTEEQCSNCKFYRSSIQFRAAFIAFVNKYFNRIKFICPSMACKTWFLKQYRDFKDITIVVYHQLTNGIYRIPPKSSDKIKIAYVGVPVTSKGWDYYKKLIAKYKDNPDYEFIYFSSVKDTSVDIRNVSVNFQTSLSAMVDALRAENVDFVILWSIWPETYSYTYYESYNSGCYVITNKDSGNIADQVKKMKSGQVLTEEQLLVFFDDFKKVCELRKDYIKQTQTVGMELNENDEITELSDQNESNEIICSARGYRFNMIAALLRVLYQIKLRYRK